MSASQVSVCDAKFDGMLLVTIGGTTHRVREDTVKRLATEIGGLDR